MKRDKFGRFVKTRFDFQCKKCGKSLCKTNYQCESRLCQSCASKIRAKIIMCSHYKEHTDLSKRKISIAKGGNGIKKNVRDLGTKKYRDWREKVFKKDSYTCQECGTMCGNGKSVYLEAHHIKCWRDYEDLRYEVSNGLTLCKKCHNKTKKFKGNQYVKK